MARSAPAQERAERHLYKGSERARHLAAAFEDLGHELCGNLQDKDSQDNLTYWLISTQVTSSATRRLIS